MLYRLVRILSFFILMGVEISFLTGQTTFTLENAILKQAGFHENVEVRTSMADAIRAPFYSLLTRQKEIYQQILSPIAVEFELRKSAESFYLLFKNEQNYIYPVWGRGNYIIRRDLRTGDFQQIKIFLQNDENTFIRLFPLDRERTVLDLELYGVPLYQGIVLPVSIEDLAVSSFARILHLTRGTIQWDQVLTDSSYPEWEQLGHLVGEVECRLPDLHVEDDGAQNLAGEYVYIETGSLQDVPGGINCSGFAKWVVDGLILGDAKVPPESLIPIMGLKESTGSGEREKNPWSSAREDRDPYFGLDWIRNLVRVLNRSVGFAAREEAGQAFDITDVPFFEYRENIGYELENLKTVLYLLAVENPGAFYLGAVNSPFGKDPVLWQYHHVALFFPWFDKNGDFQLSVMETGAVSSVENLEARYPGSFVHLVKAAAGEGFVSPDVILEGKE